MIISIILDRIEMDDKDKRLIGNISCTMSDHCKMLGVIRHDRYFDLGKGSNKFGNHVFR